MTESTPYSDDVRPAQMLHKMDQGHRKVLTEISQRVPRQAQKFFLLFGALVLFLLFLPHDPVQPQPDPLPVIHEFPRKIWQLWKVNSYALSESEARRARPWAELNLQHRYELLSDTNEEGYINSVYGPDGLNRPDIIEWLHTVKDRIVRADVLRYLIMYAEGGVYADIDVEALQPIAKWIPEHYNVNDVELVVGIEVDQPDFASHPILGKKSMTFCQWTFMSKARHPVMLKLVEHIRIWLAQVAKERGSSVADVKLDFTDIISGTGPSAFATAILEYMSEKAGHPVTWDAFHNQVESKLVGGVLVLPVEAFAAGQGHSDSGSHSTRRALVKHHYHASKWPDSHPMLNHEMYGRVEDCNWRKDCVSKWDADVEEWKTLSKAKQAEMLEAKKQKEIEDKEEREREDAEREAEEARKKKLKAEKEAAEKEKDAAAKGGVVANKKEGSVAASRKEEATKMKEAAAKETP